MLRQILSIIAAVVIGYAGFQALFVPHPAAPVTPPPRQTAAVAMAPAPPTITAPAPPPARPTLCDELHKGEFANGHPIGGQLLRALSQRHPECFGGTPIPSPTP